MCPSLSRDASLARNHTPTTVGIVSQADLTTWRVKRETCEKGVTYTEWAPASPILQSCLSRSSHLSWGQDTRRRELPGPEGTAIEMNELGPRINPHPTVLQLQRSMANLAKLDTGNIEVERLPLNM